MRCISLKGLWFLRKAHSRHTRQSSCLHEVHVLENIQHAQSRFTFSEEGYVQASCDLFCGKPTPEEAFYNTQVVCTCEDHRLKIKDHEKKEERSRKAREDIDFF